mmetsp:Transcript_1067/g.2951  ORF Transcript_1067/g.2951 Transcript_1067/m.2951 type:complete len:285 (-) Transcript_1067:339-1193(-)
MSEAAMASKDRAAEAKMKRPRSSESKGVPEAAASSSLSSSTSSSSSSSKRARMKSPPFDEYLQAVASALEENDKHYTEQRVLGYPMNAKETHRLQDVRRIIYNKFNVLNNCLDPFASANSNWKNHSLDQERRLVTELARRFLPEEQRDDPGAHDVWGYVTGGGSESNLIGIKAGLERSPPTVRTKEKLVLYTEDAHYSIPKIVREQMNLASAALPTKNDGTIDYTELRNVARVARYMGHRHFVAALTLGTTVRESLSLRHTDCATRSYLLFCRRQPYQCEHDNR